MIEIPTIEITDEDIEEQMKKTAESFPEFRKVEDRAIALDDTLLLSIETFDGAADCGIPSNPLSKKNQRVSLQDEYLPISLRGKLLDMKVGETSTVVYQTSGSQIDKNDEPAIIEVTSTVTIHEIQEPFIPEITDEWVAKFIPGANSIPEFRARVKRQMEGKAQAYFEEMKYAQCATALAARLEGGIPDELFERGIASAKQEFEAMLKQNDITKERFMKRQGITEEQLTFQFMARGRQMIAEGMALEAMADHLQLTVDEDDINAVFGDVTPQQASNMRATYERAGKTKELHRMAYCGKALEYVVAHAKITPKRLTGNREVSDIFSEV
jgi:trigger factor